MLGKETLPFDYLNKRGIRKEIISEFQIGFVPKNSDYLMN